MQGEKQYKTGLDVGSTTAKIVIIDESGQTVFSRYERHNAQVNDLLSAYFGKLDKNWATSKLLSQLPAR